ncbi:MAG: alpha/beta hydrolase [Chloroflexi bacterium]|nr:alpha/beta hydrolase [Chloroflexota bacterium]
MGTLGTIDSTDTVKLVLKRRWLRRTIKITVIMVGLLVIFFYVLLPIGLGVSVAWTPRKTCCDARPDVGKPYEDVEFSTRDGVKLAGWYVPPENGAVIIVLHGSHGDRTKVVEHVRMLVKYGYGALMFDLSKDNWVLGWQAEDEVAAAVNYLQTQPEVEHIGGLGLSLGAEALLQSAASMDELEAVVADGAGIRSYREAWLLPGVEKWFMGAQMAVMTGTVMLLTDDSPPPSLKELVSEIAPRAVLFISTGSADEAKLNRIYYKAAGEPKELWELPESGHTKGLKDNPQAYETKVIAFFNKALLG